MSRKCLAAVALASAFIVGWAAAGVKCSSGATCIDSAGGIAASDNTDFTGSISVLDEGFTIKDTAAPTKVLNFETGSITAGQTRVWTAPDRDDTIAGLGVQTFTGTQTFGAKAQFAASQGFLLGTFRIQDDGADTMVTLSTGTDVSAARTWLFNFGDADRTLTMTGDASLNQSVLTTSAPTFTGIGGAAGKVKITGTAPTLSACGTNPAIVGSDAAGRIVAGTSGPALGGCTATFAVAYSAAPSCIVTPEVATILTVQALSYTVSNTALTLTGTDLDSAAIHYHCTLAQ